MKTKLLYLNALTSLLMLSACHNEVDLYRPSTPEEVKANLFDFNTTSQVNLNLNYGTIAANALIEVYAENPLVVDEAHQTYSLKGEALCKVYLDLNGSISTNMELPTGVSTVYLYSHNWAVPTLVQVNVKNGGISYSTATRSTRADVNTLKGTLNCKAVDENKRLYTIVDWNAYGNAKGETYDFNGIFSEGNLDYKVIHNLQQSLWHGATTKPSGLDNSRYLSTTENTNTTIVKSVTDQDGVVHTIESAKVWLTALSEGAWNQNVFGYYYYKTDECPASADKVDKFIVFPNLSIAGAVPFGVYGDTAHPDYGSANAPAIPNQRAQLLFKKDDGTFTGDFPAGYTIGFFIISDGFKVNTSTGKGTISTTKPMRYTNAEWNTDLQGRSSCISLATSDGSLVYGFEDNGSDKSYEDALFMVTANPNYAIHKGDDKVVINTEEVKVPDAIQTTTSSYLFEDIWPNGGDYDLNDVMVQHAQKVTFDKDNKVKAIADEFAFVQPVGAALYTDAFAVNIDESQMGTIEIPETAVKEESTHSIILSTNTTADRGKTFIIKRTFDGSFNTSAIKPLNPFIISSYNAADEKRVEVHLPMMSPTSKAVAVDNTTNSYYYVKADGKHPFALSIPVKDFRPAKEGTNIEVEYPEFTNWVNSKGESSTDWYNHYQPITAEENTAK